MAKKAIKAKKEPSGNGVAETNNSQLTVVQDAKVEIVKVFTLAELEEEVESAYATFAEAGYQWAVAITRIHDSKLYPHAGEPGGFYTYMEERWGIKKAQAANYVAWVKQEIKLMVMLLDHDESTKVDSLATPPPEKPKHKSVTKARAARQSRRAPGKLNEEDTQELLANGSIVKVGNQFYAKGTPEFEAEMARRAASGESEPKADYLETKRKAIKKIKAAQKVAGDNRSTNFWLDDVGMDAILEHGEGWLMQYMQGNITRDDYLAGKVNGTRPTAEINSKDVALTPADKDEDDGGYILQSNLDGSVSARFEVVLPTDNDESISLEKQVEVILNAFITFNLRNKRLNSAREALKVFADAIENVENTIEKVVSAFLCVDLFFLVGYKLKYCWF